MKLSRVAGELGARILAGIERAAVIDVENIIATNTMSELMALAHPAVLPVTELDGPQVVHALELLDVGCVCLAGGGGTPERLLRAATASGLAVLSCSEPLAEVVRRAEALGLARAGGGVGRR